MNFRNVSFNSKMTAAIVAACVVGVIESGVGSRFLDQLNASSAPLYEMDIMGQGLLQDANIDLLCVGRALRHALLAETADQRTTFLLDADRQLALTRPKIDQARPLFRSAKGKAAIAEIERSWAAYAEVVPKMLSLSVASRRDGRTEGTHSFLADPPIDPPVDNAMDRTAAIEQTDARPSEADRSSFESSRRLMIGLVADAALQKASSLQQTAASMGPPGATSGPIATQARQAHPQAPSVDTMASRGGEAVGLGVDSMAAKHSTLQVADIVGVIDGIAFQSNILALNVADETARVGEPRHAVAIVAGELRRLAGRSAAAAREIRSLIGVGVEHTEQAAAQVDRALAAPSQEPRAAQPVDGAAGFELAAATK